MSKNSMLRHRLAQRHLQPCEQKHNVRPHVALTLGEALYVPGSPLRESGEREAGDARGMHAAADAVLLEHGGTCCQGVSFSGCPAPTRATQAKSGTTASAAKTTAQGPRVAENQASGASQSRFTAPNRTVTRR